MKHEERENRVRENAQEQDRQDAIQRAGGQPQPDRRRFLKTSAALAAGSAAAYSMPRVAMAGSGGGLSPGTPLRGQHFRATVPNPQQLDRHVISILETPTPYSAELWENTAFVDATTRGTFILRYTGIDDQTHEVTKEVEVDNVTRVLLVDGMPANNLGDVFNADLLTMPPKNTPAELEIDWELIILLLILLILLILLDPTYETDADNPVETLDDGRPRSPDVTQADSDAAVAGLGLNPTKKDAPSDSYDCHGWTFTNGNRWINNDQVQKILDDNGYAKRAAGQVQVGDLVVYRDGAGNITHTGVVTAVAGGVATEIKSKWGALGLYHHTPGGVPPSYGTPNYYHSARGGHKLA